MSKALRLYTVAAFGFLYLPLLVLAVFSFNASRLTVWRGFTLHWYIDVLSNRDLLEATWNSLEIGLCSTVISTIVGTLAGYAIWKKRTPWLTGSLYISLLTPEIVTGISLLALFQWLFRFLHVQLGMHTVILAHVSFSVAYAVVVILARLRSYDISLEEAALDLGANEWQVFRHVTLPFLAPGVVASFLLCFAVSFDDYIITSLVAGVDSQTLPMIVYALARRGVSPAVNALSVMITVALGTLVLIAGHLESNPNTDSRT